MLFTYSNSKWKAPVTNVIYPSNSRPVSNKYETDLTKYGSPWPTSSNTNTVKTVTKNELRSVGGSCYNRVLKSASFELVTITRSGTSLPTVCRKKLPRPLKIWRKQLKPLHNTMSSYKPTIQQIDAPGSVVQSSIDCSNSKLIYEDINHLTKCVGVKNGNKCIGGSNHIRRNGGGSKVSKNYCMSTKEYLQKRCKTFDQNQNIGKKISETKYYSTSGIKSDISGCDHIYYNPSNRAFQSQGGVSASSQTNRVKYNTITNITSKQEYATARSTMDFGLLYKGIKKTPLQCYRVIQDRAKTFCS